MLRAGVARVPISPPVGVVHMRGFANRYQPAQSMHDPLWATALVLADAGGPRACLVACDLCALSPTDSPRIEARIAALVGLPADAVWVACSHTHAGPSVVLPPEGAAAPDDASGGGGRYGAWLMDQLAGCAFLASRDPRPVAIGTGTGETRIGVNRREKRADGRIVLGENPAGPVNHRTTLVRLEDTGGSPVAAILHHACHPVVLGSDNYALSADYVGYARAAVEAALGAPVLFLQGGCGNINPSPRGSFATAERHGQRLAGTALSLWAGAATSPLREVRTAASAFDLALGPLPAPSEAAAEVERRRAVLTEREGTGNRDAIAMAQMHLRWAEGRLRAVDSGVRSARLPLRAMRWDQVGFVAAPFEPFVETAVAVRESSPHQPLLFCGYTGGVLSYIPVAEAYPEGGYEVEDAYKHFGLPAPPVPEGERALRAAFADLLTRL